MCVRRSPAAASCSPSTRSSPATPGWLAAVTVGVLVPGLVYLIPVLARPDQLGLGDAKLAASSGLALCWLNYTAVLTGLAAGVLLGVTAALTLRAAGRITARQPIAHGPAILLGALLAYACSPPTTNTQPGGQP